MSSISATHAPPLVRRPASKATAPRTGEEQQSGMMKPVKMAIFLGLHVPLAILIYRTPALGQLHSVAVLAAGLFWPGKDLKKALFVCAYIAGAEVMWRMSSATVLWEMGKYSTALICLVSMLKKDTKPNVLAILYFALLVPSVALTFSAGSLGWARRTISFNMSGPFTLMAAVWFASKVRLQMPDFVRLLIYYMAPVAGVVAICVTGLVTAESLNFTNESLEAATGGFGANQVSSILGLAVLAAFLCLMAGGQTFLGKLLLIACLTAFAAQSAMTFSRGGLYGAAGGIAVAMVFLSRARGARGRVLLVVCLVGIAVVVVFPMLNDFTGGALAMRFSDTGLTGRDNIAREDVRIWMENFLLGTGPGMARFSRATGQVAHTEFSRLLSEHGLLGLLAMLTLVLVAVQGFFQKRNALEKAMAASLMFWSILYMTNAGMRLVAPSFIFALGVVHFQAKQVQNVRRVARRIAPATAAPAIGNS